MSFRYEGEGQPDDIFRKHGLLRSPIELRGYSQPFRRRGCPVSCCASEPSSG